MVSTKKAAKLLLTTMTVNPILVQKLNCNNKTSFKRLKAKSKLVASVLLDFATKSRIFLDF